MVIHGFIGNSKAYTELIKWLKMEKPVKEKMTYNSFIVLAGPSGIGKTIGVENAVKEVDKHLIKIDCNNCANNKEFKDILQKAISSDLLSQFEQENARERIILIDELDALVSLDRTFINALCTIIESKIFNAIKIIITYNLTDLKPLSNFNIIHLNKPDEGDILIYLRHKYPDISYDKLLETVENGEGNISAILMRIEGYTNSRLDLAPEICNLYNNLTKSKIISVLEQDPWLHPLRFHENIINEFNIRKGIQSKKEEIYIKILKGLCEWDIMMCHYKNRSNDLMISLDYIASHVLLLYTLPLKKIDSPHQDNFTKMFNYLSLKKKNMIALHNGEFPWENIGNIHKIPFDNKNKKTKKFST